MAMIIVWIRKGAHEQEVRQALQRCGVTPPTKIAEIMKFDVTAVDDTVTKLKQEQCIQTAEPEILHQML